MIINTDPNWAGEYRLPTHQVTWEKDYAKAFRSRSGSSDWVVTCSCGWRYSKYAYGPAHAAEVGDRHKRRVSR